MATPVIKNLRLLDNTILVLPDSPGANVTTGLVKFHRSMGGTSLSVLINEAEQHVLFVNSMATEVVVGGVTYWAMPHMAVVGFIP